MSLATRTRVLLALSLCGAAALVGCAPSAPVDTATHWRPEVLTTYPADPESFTQGLELDPADGTLLVGTGLYGQSQIYRRTLDGEVLARTANTPEIFGEGITTVGDSIWQLTWRNHQAIRYDAATLQPRETVTLDTEGWGICQLTDSTVITSDGTSTLTVRSAENLAPIRQVQVRRGLEEQGMLNELECTKAGVFANVWGSTDVLRIDPESGQVTGVLDASSLASNAEPDPDNVLNGIAEVPGEANTFLLTGKRWPQIYKVRLRPEV